MGYTTAFDGHFSLDKPLTEAQDECLRTFAATRHGELADGTFPSIWCQWIPTRDSKGIQWDGNEKFYAYVEWLRFLIDYFLVPWGYTLSGEVVYEGEQGEHGRIIVEENIIHVVNDGDSLVSRPQDVEGDQEVQAIYWLKVNAISEMAHTVLLEAGCVVQDLPEENVVSIGISYDSNYYKRHGHDDLMIFVTEGIHLHSRDVHLEYRPDFSLGLEQSYERCILVCQDEPYESDHFDPDAIDLNNW